MPFDLFESFSPAITWSLISVGAAFAIGCAARAFADAEPAQAIPSRFGRRRRLGELLLARRALAPADLDEALALQRGTSLPLGEVLSGAGLLRPLDVTGALGDQVALAAVDPDPMRAPRDLLVKLPEEEAEALGLLPLERRDDGRAIVAFAEAPTAETLRKVELRLGATVVPQLAPLAHLRRARRRAYRRLLGAEAATTRLPLGEALVEAGHLPPARLPEALAEQRETGERLGELLVRKALASPDAVARALGVPQGFRTVRAEEIDLAALRRLGYGFCALYGLVPLRRSHEGAPLRLASPFPLHKSVVERAGVRAGAETEAVLAPAFDVRISLAIASAEAWPTGIAGVTPSLDWAELRALAAEPLAQVTDLVAIALAARKQARGPVEHLEATGHLSTAAAARIRAAALGVSLVAPAAVRPASAFPGLLPPELVRAHDLHVKQAGPRSIALAAPRPTPQLAQEVAQLFPTCPVVWEVLVTGSDVTQRPEEPRHASG